MSNMVSGLYCTFSLAATVFKTLSRQTVITYTLICMCVTSSPTFGVLLGFMSCYSLCIRENINPEIIFTVARR